MAKIKLSEIDTRAPGTTDKKAIKQQLETILEELDELQNLLFAENKHSILVILQGMDASGKDGVIRHVFTSMNPQGINVTSYKEPSPEELAHDFLWRVHRNAPQRRMIHIFNRSHYEDVVVTRVQGLISDETAKKRMAAINDFERMLQEHNNTKILKFYLHISQEEQFKRLEERLKVPRKMWKYDASDFDKSKLWDNYMKYYEEALQNCNNIPWHIVPADQNWYKSYVVASTRHKTLSDLNMQYPV